MESNQDLLKQSKIEIKLDDGYYPAYIIDIIGTTENSTDQTTVEINENTKFKIKFRSELEEITIDKLYVRESNKDEQLDQLKKGDIVEVFSNQNNDDQSKRWMKAEIEMVDTDFNVFAVKFLEKQDVEEASNDRKYLMVDENVVTALSSQSDLRLADQSKPLSANQFFKIEVPINKELEETLTGNLDWLNDPNAHFYFQNKVGAISTRFSLENKSLIFIGYENDDFNFNVMNKRIQMMISLHMKNLKNRAILEQKIEDALKKLEDVKNSTDAVPEDESNSDLCTVKFYVPQGLIGLSIGHQGKNMANAKQIEGITDVHFEKDRSNFVIKGKSLEVCNQARALLEYAEKQVLVSRKMTGKLIGKSGSVIEEIIENSGVLRIRLEHEPNEHDTSVTFIIVGTKESVETAEMLFDCYLSGLEAIDQLREKQSEVLHQLNEYRGDTSSYPPIRTGGYSRRFQNRAPRSGRQSSWSLKSKPSNQQNRNDLHEKPTEQHLNGQEVSSSNQEEQNHKTGKPRSNRHHSKKSNRTRSRHTSESQKKAPEASNSGSNSEANPDMQSKGQQVSENGLAATNGRLNGVDKANIESASQMVDDLTKLNLNESKKSYKKKFRSNRNYNAMNRGRHYNDDRRMDPRRRPNVYDNRFYHDQDYNPYANY